jgi:NAD(P)-dependent dehydrogenase (short-subunit alcohol dehydrogenase family)
MALDMFDLTDKVAVITYGDSVFGECAAASLVQAGARVVIADTSISSTALKSKNGDKSLRVGCDISNAADVKRLADAAISLTGTVDILICAPTLYDGSKDDNGTKKDNTDKLASYLKQTMLSCQTFTKHMKHQKRGKIIIFSAYFDQDVQQIVPALAMMVTANASIGMFAKSLACEMAKYNVQVNTISSSQFSRFINKAQIPGSGVNSYEISPDLLTGIQGALTYLSSSASNFTNGTEITVG